MKPIVSLRGFPPIPPRMQKDVKVGVPAASALYRRCRHIPGMEQGAPTLLREAIQAIRVQSEPNVYR